MLSDKQHPACFSTAEIIAVKSQQADSCQVVTSLIKSQSPSRHLRSYHVHLLPHHILPLLLYYILRSFGQNLRILLTASTHSRLCSSKTLQAISYIMAPSQSNLSDPQYLYDFVVSTTQGSIMPARSNVFTTPKASNRLHIFASWQMIWELPRSKHLSRRL
jgi:hypothetical protein